MSPLNIHPEEAVNVPKKKKNKTLKVMLGIAALVAVPVVGTTLAAAIGINSGSAVQFGQGVVQATACDDAVTVTPNSSFDNATGAGAFNLSTIAVTDIDAACNNKVFTLKVYGDSSDTALTVAAPSATPSGAAATSIGVTFLSAGSSTIVGNTNATVSSTTTSFTVTLATVLTSTSVYKITVESS